ncbi:conserved hypothetical protein [Chloroherpeton thalassium ATCC 35110]|uniref:Uncharacterized protein n=1 Tax=Chloroherpeton thalassium (strain ATCC 35110 / GB-78) TaxID=517418 RepID=B3QT52_CHLT3|nr:hypothetical protein [Chloroherpeton thalassium]ACF14151.1 conserved hypothetical protein [Chloroherpeton thalassium ATCC 35110]
MVKKALSIFALAFCFATSASAQLIRDLPCAGVEDASSAYMQQPTTGMFESFLSSAFDETHFSMSHSYSLTYTSLLNTTVGEYVNTMVYQFDIPLMLRADIGISHQPFGASGTQLKYGYGDGDLSGVYLKNAELLYQPLKNLSIGVSYRQYRAGILNSFWSRWPSSSFQTNQNGNLE